MTPPRQHPRRRLLGRRPPPALHRPVLPAPETPEEVLERSPDDVSRETVGGPYVAGGLPADLDSILAARTAEAFTPGWEERARASLDAAVAAQAPPPLRKDQVARLEALTAVWEREVRLEGPPDATMLYTGASRPPVPPRRTDPPVTPPPSVSPAEEAPATVALPRQAGKSIDLTPARVSSWASRHDPRSLEYAVRSQLVHAVPLRDVLLDHGPILDQGTTPPLSLRDAAACTGYAAAAAANVLERAARGPRIYGPADALEAYHRAQDLDALAGHDYPGTSVLAVMKAGQELGWWSTYLWAVRGTKDIAQVLLQLAAPVVLGIPWPAGMESPDPAGVLHPTGPAGMGHSLAVVGMVRQLAGGVAGIHFVLQQSRGPAEGAGGLVYLHHRDLAALLAGSGEAAVPLPA